MTADAPPPKRFPTLRLGLASALLLWLAQPPLGWQPLAWVAPIGWLGIVRREEPLDRGDWLRVYLSGVVYWLLAIHWIRLPHPLTILGWPLLCGYLGLYPLAFVWLCRVGARSRVARENPPPPRGEGPGEGAPRVPASPPPLTPPPEGGGGFALRLPLWLVAPVVWVGLEYAQAHLFTGFLMGAVSHSQSDQLWLTPIAEYLGAYGVTSLVVGCAAVLTIAAHFARHWAPVGPGFVVAAFLSLLFLNGYVVNSVIGSLSRVEAGPKNPSGSHLTVALIQGNTLATWDPDPDRHRKIMDAQSRLSVEAVERAKAEGKTLDLVVWPESMFRPAVDTYDGATTPPPGTDENLLASHENTRAWLEALAAKLDTPLLVGCDHYDWTRGPTGLPEAECFNSAMLVDAEGEITAIYDKTHRVPFGEYIPLASGMPALYFLTPMSGGLRPGDGPVSMELTTKSGETVRLAPSICYETVVPHVIRRHVKELTDRGEAPDLLVNVTNDAWFWGASELDMHLACGVYRAVETGTPMVIAANGGLSAAISARGEVLAVSPRMEEHVLIVDVPLANRAAPTPYVRHGDWFAGGCLIVCAGLAILGVLPKKKPPKPPREGEAPAEPSPAG